MWDFFQALKQCLYAFFFFFCQASHVSWFAVRNATPVDTYLARTCLFPDVAVHVQVSS